MAAYLTVVSENSVDEIWDEGGFETFFKENPAAKASRGLLFLLFCS